jgi:hypothetical protein
MLTRIIVATQTILRDESVLISSMGSEGRKNGGFSIVASGNGEPDEG